MKNYGSAKLALLLNAKFVAAQLTDQDRALSESPFMASLVEEVGVHELCTQSKRVETWGQCRALPRL